MIATSKLRKLRELFGTTVREERLRIGISQEVLAEKAGLHRTYVGAIERGERNVSIDNIERIARALAVKPSDLFSRSGR